MRNKHMLITTLLMILTTCLICRCNYRIGLPLMAATYVTAVLGVASCIKNILEIAIDGILTES